MTMPSKPVSSFLSASPNARALARMDLGFGVSTAVWSNRNDRVTYEAPQGHTFSFYLRGGVGTWRTDGAPTHGWPGAVCIMPQGQSSTWNITRPFVFLHLYVPDDELRRSFAETFDRDARQLDLADKTFVQAQQLSDPFIALLAAIRSENIAFAEEAAVDLIAKVLSCGRFGKERQLRLSGGLSPRKLRELRDFVEANLDQAIRLHELSELVGLSSYHLQRSFRASCGVSPQKWIAHRRVSRAKRLIHGGEPLAQVATACGFSSQSHLSRVFKEGTGVTPGAFRKAVC